MQNAAVRSTVSPFSECGSSTRSFSPLLRTAAPFSDGRLIVQKKVTYTEGYRYQLEADYDDVIEVRPLCKVVIEHGSLDVDGTLKILNAYAWDGPSGPTVRTKSSIRGSLVHDFLYQLMREGCLDEATWRDMADNILYRILVEDGMLRFRAWYWRQGVKWFGGPAGDPANDKLMLSAP